MTTAVQVRDALIALMNAAPANTACNAKSLGQIDALGDARPEAYTEVMVAEKPAGMERDGSLSPSTAWRITTRAVGRTEDLAEDERARARARLLEKTITVSSVTSTDINSPVADNPIAPDGEWFSGPSEWSLYL